MDRIGLLLVEEDGKRATARCVRTGYQPVYLKEGFSADLNDTSLNALIESGESRVINDLEAYLAEHPNSWTTQQLVKEGLRSSLTTPLLDEGKVIGLLSRDSRQHHAYGYHQIELHQAISQRISQAALRALQIERLKAANSSYLEVLGFISHELKNPLASIVMDCKVLLDGYLGELDPPQHDRINKVVRKSEYLLSLIREYLDLARIEGGKLAVNFLQDVDIRNTVFDAAIDLVRGQIDDRGMRLDMTGVPETFTGDCDPDLLLVVMVNLLSNAAKYGNEGGLILVRTESSLSGFKVSVRNEGPGFSEPDRDQLFRKFSRLNNPELRKRRGTGVGLYNSWRIIQQHGGRIHADSEPGKWAEFTFEIPQPLECRLDQKPD